MLIENDFKARRQAILPVYLPNNLIQSSAELRNNYSIGCSGKVRKERSKRWRVAKFQLA